MEHAKSFCKNVEIEKVSLTDDFRGFFTHFLRSLLSVCYNFCVGDISIISLIAFSKPATRGVERNSAVNYSLDKKGNMLLNSAKLWLDYLWIIIHSASAELSAEMPENRFIKLKILLKHSRML